MKYFIVIVSKAATINWPMRKENKNMDDEHDVFKALSPQDPPTSEFFEGGELASGLTGVHSH